MARDRNLDAAAALGLLMVITFACGRERTDAPVVSRTPAGRSVSPSGAEAAHRGRSLVRLVNAVPDLPSISVSGDDQPLFEGVAPKGVTPYHEIKDNVVTFRLRAGRDSAVLADNKETMTDGYRYTLVAMPADGGRGVRIRVIHDEVVPQAGKVRIRFVDAAPAADDVDLAIRGAKDALFEGVKAGGEAGYKDIDPTTATLEVRSDDRGRKPVEVKNLRLEAGRVYTIVLVGTGSRSLEALTVEDAVTAETASAADRR